MNNLSILILSVLFLFSCSQEAKKKEPVAPPVLVEESSSSDEVIPNDSIHEEEPTLRAKFVEFQFGDAEHYSFEKESGEKVVFDGCNIDNFDFSTELDESEMNETNQGFGSNSELQGKWFILTYITREQPMYIDGPMGTARIINKAVLDKE
jgi:hypothetical protein